MGCRWGTYLRKHGEFSYGSMLFFSRPRSWAFRVRTHGPVGHRMPPLAAARRRSGVRTGAPVLGPGPRLAGLYRLRRFPGTAAVDWPPSCGVCGTPRPNSPLDVGPPPSGRGVWSPPWATRVECPQTPVRTGRLRRRSGASADNAASPRPCGVQREEYRNIHVHAVSCQKTHLTTSRICISCMGPSIGTTQAQMIMPEKRCTKFQSWVGLPPSTSISQLQGRITTRPLRGKFL